MQDTNTNERVVGALLRERESLIDVLRLMPNSAERDRMLQRLSELNHDLEALGYERVYPN
ncbi:MAG: hypothetical protein ACOC0P_00695 [Planctomycetota bacterium]